jgi:phage-related protein/DNA-binding XRE family transcriptional regulator
MSGDDRPLVWLADVVKTPPFSAAARVEAGTLLRRLQRGEVLMMPASRPMPSIGAGCHELRVRDADANWRIIYRVDADAIVIADVFAKKTAATPGRSSAPASNAWHRMSGPLPNEGDAMKDAKRNKLRKAGWKVGSAADFLGLTAEEAALIELKLLLAANLRERRERAGLTQEQLAEHLGSSQSRVAKMEAAEVGVSMDLLIRGLLVLGVTRRELGRLIGGKRSAA